MNTTPTLSQSSIPTLIPRANYRVLNNRHSLTLITILGLLIFGLPILPTQAQAMTANMGPGTTGMNGGTGGGGTFTLGYPAVSQANIDKQIFSGNEEMLRNDVDYEDYLLHKRTAFAQQLQQSDQSDEKLRAYAEQRLKTLTQAKGKLTAAQQAESHDLMDWLNKDAQQRANNLAWLKRQDQALATVEQDQTISVENQRNALHNMFEDNLNVDAQYKWNQQMQLAALHQYQTVNGELYGSHQPFANYSRYGGYGSYGNRWGY